MQLKRTNTNTLKVKIAKFFVSGQVQLPRGADRRVQRLHQAVPCQPPEGRGPQEKGQVRRRQQEEAAVQRWTSHSNCLKVAP